MNFTKKKFNKKQVERPKTRKELRKDKRLQKKSNRAFFHKKKKELKIEYRNRLKQQKQGNKKKNLPPNDKEIQSDNDEDIEEHTEKIHKQANDEEEEIESDFEFSDEEIEMKFKNKNTTTKTPSKSVRPIPTPIDQERQKDKQKQRRYEKEMQKQRIRQLKSANEDEDKIIRKLEKQLKIDKKRSEKNVPKMFDDGLDYALELCLPENIQKMYTAAKEAAESDTDDGFEEDLCIAAGVGTGSSTKKRKLNQIDEKDDLKGKKQKVDKRLNKLRKAESKYFGSDDDLDSDMSGVDSEFDNDSDEEGADVSLEATEKSDDDDAPEELTINRSKNQKSRKIVKTEQSHDSESDYSDEDESKEQDEEFSDSENDGGGSDFDVSDDDGKENSNDEKNDDLWEDIYGRKRNKDGEIIADDATITSDDMPTKYVPPHVRARMAAANKDDSDGVDPKRQETIMRIRKQLKGYLNRLSEANMHKIASDIDQMYMKNSRFDMNNSLTKLIMESLISNVIAPERMVLEHALLIAVLHANVGSEVGSHFLQAIIDKFDEMFKNIDQYDVENKELDNVLYIICHMYTFKIFQHNLIYELLHQLSNNLSEKSIECILLALRSIGFALRKEDPIMLKDLITTLQKKSNEASDEIRNNSRCKYMLDVLLAIKNNNVNKIPQYDPTVAEHLRKILKSLLINDKYVTTLNITLDDLRNADKRGKWWVIGSAWSGNVKDIGSAASSSSVSKSNDHQQQFSEQLLQLAKQQRMNTDDRRNVFCVLMSAADYIESFEKLLQLNIKDHRVIVTIIIHCCLSEKIFNPYYGVLAQKFCDYDRKYQLAIQFAIWDRIKDIQSHTQIQIKNLSKFLQHLIENGGLALSVLKIIEFGQLDKNTMRLVRQLMLSILLSKEDTCKKIFARIAPSLKLKSFKDSLRLFMHHFLIAGAQKSGIDDDKLALLRKRIHIADKSLETIGSKIEL